MVFNIDLDITNTIIINIIIILFYLFYNIIIPLFKYVLILRKTHMILFLPTRFTRFTR